MEHGIGTVHLIRWQGRRNRRLRPGVSAWTAVMLVCAVAGAVMLTAQACGALRWPPPLSMLPAALFLLSLGAPILAVGRAVIGWLTG